MQQSGGAGAGRFLARKGSFIQILPRKQENCRLFKGKENESINYPWLQLMRVLSDS